MVSFSSHRPIETLPYVKSGFYIALFALCMHLLRQSEVRYHIFYTSSIAFLFVVSTIMVIVEATDMLHTSVARFAAVKTQGFLPLLAGDTLKQVIDTASFKVRIILNMTVDCITIHRCYIIWGSSKLILV
ncbi:hypothetical protein L218DRAFT_887620, partial [Marasmius fiardii PR-910]